MQLITRISRLVQSHGANITRGFTKSSRIFQGKGSVESLPTLTLFTKEDCSLCDDAMNVLRPHLSKVRFEEIDITEEGNETYYKKYRFDIPVFHLNGRFLMKHRADEKLFLEKLKKLSENT